MFAGVHRESAGALAESVALRPELASVALLAETVVHANLEMWNKRISGKRLKIKSTRKRSVRVLLVHCERHAVQRLVAQPFTGYQELH